MTIYKKQFGEKAQAERQTSKNNCQASKRDSSTLNGPQQLLREFSQQSATMISRLETLQRNLNKLATTDAPNRAKRFLQVRQQYHSQLKALTEKYRSDLVAKSDENKQLKLRLRTAEDALNGSQQGESKEKLHTLLQNLWKANKNLRLAHDKQSDRITLLKQDYEKLQQRYTQLENDQSKLVRKKVLLEAKATSTDTLQELRGRLEQSEQDLYKMKRQLASATRRSADEFIKKLEDMDMVAVLFDPDKGQLTLTAQQLRAYLSSNKKQDLNEIYISKTTYKSWLDHCDEKKCNAILKTTGKVCGHAIPLVKNPRDFILGISDRCDTHQDKTLLESVSSSKKTA